MYVNFQQNLVNRAVKTVLTRFICKKLQTFINLQLLIIILKKLIISDMHHRICISISSKIGLVDHSKPCSQTVV